MGEAVTIDQVRGELRRRLVLLSQRPAPARTADLAQELAAIRAIAQGHGLRPAVAVAHLLDDALARGEHGALIHDWLGVLGDAIVSERVDAQACASFAAICSVRLAH